ncbi:MAG TPA: MAPEG family protein [Sphingomicrobium sp.]
MPIELKLLVYSAILALVQMVVAAVFAQTQVGLPALAGNRENMPELTGPAGRAQRAHRNMLESFAIFAAVVLVAQATGRLDAITALGAQIFFWSRLLYALVYVVGIPWLRTAVWAVSAAGIIMVLSQLL